MASDRVDLMKPRPAGCSLWLIDYFFWKPVLLAEVGWALTNICYFSFIGCASNFIVFVWVDGLTKEAPLPASTFVLGSVLTPTSFVASLSFSI